METDLGQYSVVTSKVETSPFPQAISEEANHKGKDLYVLLWLVGVFRTP